uniref:Bifunctional coenzyme A synthase-like n=1 Tax=Dermatophagoides pteronyssinus TaxID=6956 RepID=A0A6P6YJC6_DERPT|nr:bifunctional coenzyme A synthase-like [Dermatophagoides pteronyssinus]
MFQHGLMILNYRPKTAKSFLTHVGSYLRLASDKISKTLYVSLALNDNNVIDCRNDLQKIVPAIYVEAHRRAPLLDVRVLHHSYYRNEMISKKRSLQFRPQILFTNEQWKDDLLRQYLSKLNLADDHSNMSIVSLSSNHSSISDPVNHESSLISDQVYDNVCIGGTFDNLHNGHKILLSTAQLKCNRSLTIGVTNEQMLTTKILPELIESCEKRIHSLNLYLNDVDPYIHYNVCEISDPFGPAIVDPTLEAIIVSEETIRGGEKINEIRISKGMKPLKIDVIKLLQDDHKESGVEENKVSSSSLRIRKLGTLLKPPEPRPNLPDKPYLIGLTGMIASGKSSIAKKLETLGAGIINVDKLAHKTYQSSDMPAYKKIVETFGKDILDDNGQINRIKLGKIVFDDEAKLKLLNSFVWPEVRRLLQLEIDQMKTKYRVIVLEIALLIENYRMDQVHQVWLTILNQKEVVRRLMERNQLSESDALKRIEKIMPCKQKMPYANVIFCTQWEEEFTMEQVKRAWKMLNEQFVK